MANNIFQKLVLATAGTALSLAAIEACPAHAATITYDFTVDVTGGSLRGNSYNGSFSYDDTSPSPAGLQQPYFNVSDFNFGFAGRTYTQSDLRLDGRRLSTAFPLNITGGETVYSETSVSSIPRGGTLQSIQFGNVGFRGFPDSTSQPLFYFNASPTNSFFAYQLPGERYNPGSGSVRYSSRSTSIPEPEDTVYGLVVLGLGWLLRKKIASPKRASN